MHSGRILRHRKPEAPRGRQPRRYRASLTFNFMSGPQALLEDLQEEIQRRVDKRKRKQAT
jgi:hypothetical protein